jgi:Ca-activated chloride channel family protein
VADHPACVNADAGAAEQEAATLFRDYLLGEEGQELALNAGLRPVNEAVTVGAPLDESNGVDLEQPELVFAAPTADTLFAVQELWQSARKDVNLVMLLDVSGSMSGAKIESMRRAAVQFVEQMGEEDYLTIISFSYEPVPLTKYQQVGENRGAIVEAIRALEAEGDTALYDAIGEGATLLANTTRSDTTNALVVLTDGLDTYSYVYTQESALDAVAQSGATVFTIAYGSDADEELLENLAYQANGNYFRGDEASIAAIYDEMSAAFGGSVGVGR